MATETCIQIGNGKIARIHREIFPSTVKVVGIIVRDVAKHQKLVAEDVTFSKDVLVFGSVEAAVNAVDKPFFWDIASDDDTHLEYVQNILAVDPEANIVLSKTFYDPQKFEAFKEIINKTRAKITFVENYLYTPVVDKMKELLQRENLSNLAIYIDFTKNRVKDMEHGRYVQKDLGVLGYEGTHIVTLLTRLGRMIDKVTCFEDLPLVFPNGEELPHNGSALLQGITKTNDRVFVYTSMNGVLRYNIHELGFGGNVQYGDERRYRVLIVEDKQKGVKIVGQFDPVLGLPRFVGRVLLFKDDKLVEKFDNIPENTLKKAYGDYLDFFHGKIEQPFDFRLIQEFAKLYEVFQKKAHGEIIACDLNQTNK